VFSRRLHLWNGHGNRDSIVSGALQAVMGKGHVGDVNQILDQTVIAIGQISRVGSRDFELRLQMAAFQDVTRMTLGLSLAQPNPNQLHGNLRGEAGHLRAFTCSHLLRCSVLDLWNLGATALGVEFPAMVCTLQAFGLRLYAPF